MISRTLFPLIVVSCFIGSCVTPAALEDPAERYIKTTVEIHDSAQVSSVRILPLMNFTATNCSTELQLTAYKYNWVKQLVICVRPFHMSGGTKVYDSLEVIELNVQEAQAIIDNYKKLEEQLLLEKPVSGEYVYRDYTVNDELFISYRGTLNPVLKRVVPSLTIDFWVNSVKYTLPTTDVIGKLQAFVAY